MDKLIGVVTVTFNSASVIDGFMTSVLGQTFANFRVYVIDNSSTDGTLALVRSYSDSRVVVISNTENVGVAQGNNIGIRAAIRDHCGAVLLVNNDTVFGPDLFSKLHNAMQSYHCEMVAPKIYYFDNPKTIYSAGGYFSRIRKNCGHFGENQEDSGRFDAARFVSYNPTCCLLVRIDVFERIGLMDPRYFVYFDDADFCYRAHIAGMRLLYFPTATMLHKAGSLTGKLSDFSIRYSIRNRVYFALKHHSLWESVPFLFVFQIVLFFRWAFRRLGLRPLRLFESAFWEGVEVFRSARRAGWQSREESVLS